MAANARRLPDLATLAAGFDAPLRVNVCQAVRSTAFVPSYQQYWDGFERLFGETEVLAVSEPLVRAMAGLPRLPGGCGVTTIRVTPQATVLPCVYWPGDGDPLSLLLETGAGIVETEAFRAARLLPAACTTCPFKEVCGGGCAGRRRLRDGLDQPDPYCPVVRGEQKVLHVRLAPPEDLPKVGSACTTIVRR